MALQNKYRQYVNGYKEEYLRTEKHKYRQYLTSRLNCSNYERATYLNFDLNSDTRRALTRLRLSCNNLPVNKLRLKNVTYRLRHCDRCASVDIGDAYHALFQCLNTNLCLNTDLCLTTYLCLNT